MPYLNLDLDYFTHPKVMRLAALLGPEAVAFPIKLWCHVGKYHCATGMLEGYSKDEIESLLGWSGEKGKLIEKFLTLEFLSCSGENYIIHDWFDHAGHLAAFKKRAKTAAKKRWKSYATSIAVSNRKHKITNAPNLPILTVPTKPQKRSERRRTLEEFVVTDEIRSWAMTEFGVSIPDDVVEEFKDHWRKEPDKKLRTDWKATFQNRVRQLVGWGTLKAKSTSGPVLPQAKCAYANEPCDAYALPGSRYCEEHKALIQQVQASMFRHKPAKHPTEPQKIPSAANTFGSRVDFIGKTM